MIEQLRVGPIGLNCYIVKLKDEPLVVVDPGAEAGRIAERVLALEPRDAVLVVLTHGHLDHTAALPEIRRLLAEAGVSVRIGVHRKDEMYFGAKSAETNERIFRGINAIGYFRKFWTPIPDPDFFLEPGTALPGTSISVLHTPGHTLGSCSFYIQSENSVLTGDTLFLDGRGRTDNFDSDEILLIESITQTLFGLPGRTVAYPGHGDATVLENEKRYFSH